MRTILLLEDLEERVRAFEEAVSTLGEARLVLWRDAHAMIRDLPGLLPTASLVSLDHDLLPQKGIPSSPGSGLDVCEFLARRKPECPVLLHTANYIKVWPMMNELSFAGWDIHRTPPVGMQEGWIESVWLPRVRMLLERRV